MSVKSGLSVESRLSQLSRRTYSKKTLSTQELQQQEVEKARRKQKEQMRRNEASCRKALSGTMGMTAAMAGRAECSLKCTIPKEFNLSNRTRARSQSTEQHDDAKSADGRNSQPTTPRAGTPRGPAARKPTPTKWRPHLQVNGTNSSRSSQQPSSDQKRRSLSCPPADADKAFGPRPRVSTPRGGHRTLRAAAADAAGQGAHQNARPAAKRETPASQASLADGANADPFASNAARARERAARTMEKLEGQHTQDRQAKGTLFKRSTVASAGAGATGASRVTGSSTGITSVAAVAGAAGMQRSTAATNSAKVIAARR
jgi:hypothetical protein